VVDDWSWWTAGVWRTVTTVSRRRVLAALGVLTGAAAGGGAVGTLGLPRSGSVAPAVVPFAGTQQAGIVTPPQAHLCFAAFDVTAPTRSALVSLLRRWSDAAGQLTAGVLGPGDSPEADALPARLTVTFGFGPTLFDAGGVDRFGLRDRRPAPLLPVPPMPGDALDPDRSDGDLAVQACADDPVVARHAVRTLARLAGRDAVPRWRQTGFAAARNLFGYRDGTANPTSERDLDTHVWVGADDQPWMRAGSYLVVRRIRMLLEAWDRVPVDRQDAIVGRRRSTGARLPAPVDAHVRLAAPAGNGGARLLRRGYAYDDGLTPSGHADAGLFFLCFQRDPRRQFTAIQRRLAANDAMRGFVQHRASAVFACPGGVGPTGWVGEALFS
jgi:deferrochelatase/peroxidase EfeB